MAPPHLFRYGAALGLATADKLLRIMFKTMRSKLALPKIIHNFGNIKTDYDMLTQVLLLFMAGGE